MTPDNHGDEMWLPIPGYGSRYSISSHGRIVSHRRTGDHMLIPSYFESAGRVHLYDGTKTRRFRVAALVLLAFVGPAPDEHEIVYRDGDRTNHRLDNLAYAPLPKIKHAPPGGGALAMFRTGLTADQARTIAASPDKAADVARDFGISIYTVNRIRQGQLWTDETAAVRRTSYQRRPAAVLTDADVSAILRSSESIRTLAERYDVAESTVNNIRRGKSWKHIPRPEPE